MRPLDTYQPPRAPWRRLRFWSALLGETLTDRDLGRLARLRLSPGQPAVIHGREHLPGDGTFVLALNHFRRGQTLDVLAAAALAAEATRPDLAGRFLIVAGQRASQSTARRHPIARLVRWLNEQGRRRWADHLLQLPWQNRRPSIGALRAWRQRLTQQPALVFPEGQAALQFGAIRLGAGRWLATLPVPTLPAGVWWADDAWHVHFGRPVRWSHRPDLHDLQLGLAIADHLPDELAARWRDNLQRWRAVHAVEVPGAGYGVRVRSATPGSETSAGHALPNLSPPSTAIVANHATPSPAPRHPHPAPGIDRQSYLL